MPAYLTKLVIYDSVLFNRTGQVRRWADGVERRFTMNAIEEAPSSLETGRLNKSRANAAFPPGSMKLLIRGDVDRIAPKHLQTTVSVDVPYAMYVIRGTGAIFPRGEYLYVPSNPGFGTGTRQKWVRGQEPNNFLARAMDETARRHPSLRGFSPALGL